MRISIHFLRSPFLWLGLISLTLVGCATSPYHEAASKKTFAGKTIVITGASSGFGRGAALKLGAQGANVVLAARRTKVLQEVAEQVKAAGGSALVVTTDVANADDITKLARAAVSHFGKIDVWVNNAGVGVIGPFWEGPVEDYSRLVDINLKV